MDEEQPRTTLDEEKLYPLDTMEKDIVDQELIKHEADPEATTKDSAEDEATRTNESEGHSETTADAKAKIAAP